MHGPTDKAQAGGVIPGPGPGCGLGGQRNAASANGPREAALGHAK
jgi:hypothetical protein